jgi:hypothetical protein
MFYIAARETSRPDQGSRLFFEMGGADLTRIQAAGDSILDPDDIGVEFAEIAVVPRPVQESRRRMTGFTANLPYASS